MFQYLLILFIFKSFANPYCEQFDGEKYDDCVLSGKHDSVPIKDEDIASGESESCLGKGNDKDMKSCLAEAHDRAQRNAQRRVERERAAGKPPEPRQQLRCEAEKAKNDCNTAHAAAQEAIANISMSIDRKVPVIERCIAACTRVTTTVAAMTAGCTMDQIRDIAATFSKNHATCKVSGQAKAKDDKDDGGIPACKSDGSNMAMCDPTKEQEFVINSNTKIYGDQYVVSSPTYGESICTYRGGGSPDDCQTPSGETFYQDIYGRSHSNLNSATIGNSLSPSFGDPFASTDQTGGVITGATGTGTGGNKVVTPVTAAAAGNTTRAAAVASETKAATPAEAAQQQGQQSQQEQQQQQQQQQQQVASSGGQGGMGSGAGSAGGSGSSSSNPFANTNFSPQSFNNSSANNSGDTSNPEVSNTYDPRAGETRGGDSSNLNENGQFRSTAGHLNSGFGGAEGVNRNSNGGISLASVGNSGQSSGDRRAAQKGKQEGGAATASLQRGIFYKGSGKTVQLANKARDTATRKRRMKKKKMKKDCGNDTRCIAQFLSGGKKRRGRSQRGLASVSSQLPKGVWRGYEDILTHMAKVHNKMDLDHQGEISNGD
jgi:hypothetical protein